MPLSVQLAYHFRLAILGGFQIQTEKGLYKLDPAQVALFVVVDTPKRTLSEAPRLTQLVLSRLGGCGARSAAAIREVLCIVLAESSAKGTFLESNWDSLQLDYGGGYAFAHLCAPSKL